MIFRNTLYVALSLASALLAGGCQSQRISTEPIPRVSAAEQFQQQGGAVNSSDETRSRPWWQTFDDSVLESLIAKALRQNLELQQFAARVEQAAALRAQAGARLFPELLGSADYEMSWRDVDQPVLRDRTESASVGGLLNWELDVWGRLRQARNAQQHELEAARFDRMGAELLLSAAVAETYFELLEQREQVRVIREQIAVNETLLDLTRLRFGQGQSSIVDVLQQNEQLAATRALLPDAEAREGELRFALQVLLGDAPGAPLPSLGRLPLLPASFGGTGVPSDLLLNRPDLMAQQKRVEALDSRVGEALADRMPRFEIGGGLFLIGDPGLSTLVANALGSVVAPMFDGGERRAVVALRRAQLNEAVAAFSNTYLEAVRDVETALLRERKQAERVALQEKQLDAATRLLRETRNRYSQGLTDYLPVLAAVSTEQNLQRDLITSRRELLSARVALFRALGGPMNTPPVLVSKKTRDE